MIHPVFFMPLGRQIQQGNAQRKLLQSNYFIHIVTGAITVLLYWIYSINYPLQLAGAVYLTVIIVIVLFYWKAELTKWNLFTASIVFGFIIYFRSVNEIVEITPLWPGIFTGLVGSGALSILLILIIEAGSKNVATAESFFIKRLINLLFVLIGIRIAWDVAILFNLSVATEYGETISALRFFWQAASTRLMLLLLSGIFLPAIYLLLLRKKLIIVTAKVRLVLVSLFFISIITAEFLSKYFLLQFGIVL